MNHASFLAALGSYAESATLFGVKPRDIGHWKTRGIPARLWPLAARIAEDRGIDFTLDDLAGLPRRMEAA